MPPASVKKGNEKTVFNTLYKPKPQRTVSFKYRLGDTVRISKLRGVFRKGYEHNIITERIARDSPVYRLSDCAGEVLKDTFYEPELQQVIIDKKKEFKIEKILARKKSGCKNMVFVKWLGWPEKLNS